MIGVKLDELCPPPPSKDGRYCKEMNYFVKLDAQDRLQNSIVLEWLQ